MRTKDVRKQMIFFRARGANPEGFIPNVMGF
jgi:hypothetical protein